MAGSNYIYCAVCHKKALYIGDHGCPEALMVVCATCAPLHVSVPIDALNKAIVGLEMTRDGQLATWRPERSEAVAMLRSLLSTEAAND